MKYVNLRKILLFILIAFVGITFFCACNNQISFTISYEVTEGGIIIGDCTQTIRKGKDGARVTAVADDGYTFINWSDGNTNAERHESSVSTNVSFTALFIKTTFSVQYVADDGGSIEGTQNQFIKIGETTSAVTAIPNTGYRFTKWSDSNTNPIRYDSNVTEDMIITAFFSQTICTVQYSADVGGYIDGTKKQRIVYGEDADVVTAAADTGYKFVKWSDDVVTATRTDINVITDLNITAIFEKITFTVRYIAGQGGFISGESVQTVFYGEDSTEVILGLKPGYMFIDWSDNYGFHERRDRNVTEDISVTANFIFLFAGGDGTMEKPLLIDNYDQFLMMNIFPDSHYKLNKDLNLNGINHLPPFHWGYMFNGSFDGGGKTIRNLTIDRYLPQPSLFGSIGPSGSVKNLKVLNFEIRVPNYNTSRDINNEITIVPLYVGAVCGVAYGTLSGIIVSGKITSAALDFNGIAIGGIAGLSTSVVQNCHSNIDINLSGVSVGDGNFAVGGLIGTAYGNVISCSTEGKIDIQYASTLDGGFVGGICGGLIGTIELSNLDIIISNCYATNDIFINSTSTCSGGFIGYINVENSTIFISNSYSTGNVTVSSGSFIGGFVGQFSARHSVINITNCYANGDVTSPTGDRCGGFVGYFSVSNSSGNLSYCYATGSVKAETAGGFAGTLNASLLSDNFVVSYCYASGTIEGEKNAAGFAFDVIRVNIFRTYATGNVHGEEWSVGFIGSLLYGNAEECFSTGNVSASTTNISVNLYISGFIGLISSGNIINSYSIGNVTVINNYESCDIAGFVIALTRAKIINCYYSGKISGIANDYDWVGGIASKIQNSEIINCYWLNHYDGLANTAVYKALDQNAINIIEIDNLSDMYELSDLLNEDLIIWVDLPNNTPLLKFIIDNLINI